MSTHHDTLLQVALAVPVGDFFDYLCPASHALPLIGCRVMAPFGKRQLVGIVTGHIDRSDSQVPTAKLKAISEIIDDTPIIGDELIRLASWLSGYYHHPLGDVYSVMLPTLINQGKPITVPRTVYQARAYVAHNDSLNKPKSNSVENSSSSLDNDPTGDPKNSREQADQLEVLLAQLPKTAKKQRQLFHEIYRHEGGLDQAALTAIGASRQTLKALMDRGLISAREVLASPKKPSTPALKQAHMPANDEQAAAIKTIIKAHDHRRYQGFLLDGVTGSGKTEVYLQAIDHVLRQGRQVLILVPEIGLTPQTKARFADRFDANICLLHSNLTDSERLAGWRDCQSGMAQIILGTRSSILYPFYDLGLIIIDEAHDSSYKQQDHLRYHACDVAMMRGVFAQIPVVLATATPSLEHLKLVDDGKLSLLKLNNRAGTASTAALHLVDLRLGSQAVMHTDGQLIHTPFAQLTVRLMREALAKGEQVLVFINRRGYAPILVCAACGHQADCPNCDAHLTVHKNNLQPIYSTLRCHHCGYIAPLPAHCPQCNSANLDSIGAGTTRLVEHLHALFANPQASQITYPIFQIDRDTMRKKDAWDKLSEEIHRDRPAILVGTQMIAKGHHFPNVTLVVIANADLGFLSPDFRSPEHTAQRIIQVAGRAGRAQKPGRVLIQTMQPHSPLLTHLVQDGYESFAKDLLAERRQLGLPPYSHAALIRAESSHHARAKAAIMDAKKCLPNPHPFAINGPIDAPMAKKNNRYQVQLLILAKHRSELHTCLDAWWPKVQSLPSVKAVKISLDVDPMGW